MKHVLIVIPTLGTGGAERTVVSLANHLSRNWAVTLVTFEPALSFFALSPLVQQLSLKRTRSNAALAKFILIPRLRRLFRKESPDICVGYSLHAGIVAALASLGTPVRSIVCERSDPRRYHPFKRALALLSWLVADGAVFQSEYARSQYRCHKGPARVIPNAIDQSSLLPVTRERAEYVLFVGRLESVKDPVLALQSFAHIASEFPSLNLIFAGDGTLRPTLEDLAHYYGLANRVTFMGNVLDVFPLYESARAYISTSLHEGYPNALLEAVAMGVPVVVRDSPSYTQRSLVRQGSGVLVTAPDPIRIGDALGMVLRENAFLERAITSSSQVRERHDISSVMLNWEALLLSVADA